MDSPLLDLYSDHGLSIFLSSWHFYTGLTQQQHQVWFSILLKDTSTGKLGIRGALVAGL